MWILFLGFIVNLFQNSLCLSQDIKTWHPNTNFLNPRNWENGKLPCANDQVIFPASSPIITLMPDSLSIRGMILPTNGELLFLENATINLLEEIESATCIGKDVHFQATTDYWYDPVNWNITSDRAFPRIPNRRNAAVPDALQVPCVTDKVQFLEKTTFRVHVFYPITKVASIVINGKSYSQSEFDDLLRSHVGSLLFPDNPRIQITNSPCTDESGCACGNDGPEVKPTICQQVTPYCPALECSDPITPVGNCCPICGARIVIKRKDNFKIDTLMTLYASFLDKIYQRIFWKKIYIKLMTSIIKYAIENISKEEYKDIESFTAKTFEGDIQSVFVDGPQYKGLANKAADRIFDALNSDLNGAQLYAVRSVKIYKSENWNSDVPTYERRSGGMSSGGLASIIILTIIAFGLGVGFYIYRKRHIPGFDFARFDLRGDKIELELGTTPHDELQPVEPIEPTSPQDEKNKGFDNPVYGTSVEEVPSAAAESAIEKGFVENPMFMVFQDSLQQDSKEKK